MYAPQRGAAAGALLAAFVIAAGSACAPATVRSPALAWDATRRAESRISVVVQNLEYLDMTIYSVMAGSRIRLGTVTSNRTARFTIPRAHQHASDLELVADPIGSRRTISSGFFMATEGQEIRWNVSRIRGANSLTVW